MSSLPSSTYIRRMTPADLDQVIALAASVENAPHWPRSAYLAALDPEAAPLRMALVAEAPRAGVADPSVKSSPLGRGVVAGFAVASLLAAQAELESIAVAPQFQRRGLARLLFAELVAELRTARATEVILEVRASNLPALGLYRRLGFVETGRRPRYYADPDDDAILVGLGLESLAHPAAAAQVR
jgi:ribosomal-protein-alanine N-acetyltransferase